MVHKTKNPSYCKQFSETPLTDLTVGKLIDQAAEKYGDLEGLICSDINLRRTFSELKTEIDNLAVGFLMIGLESGDRLGCFGPNGHPYYLSQMAAWKAGLIFVHINQGCTGNDLLHCLKNVGVKCLVIPSTSTPCHHFKTVVQLLPEILECKPGETKSGAVPDLTCVITTMESKSNDSRGTYCLFEVMKMGTQDKSRETLAKREKSIESGDICNIQFTSGTTGLPKGTRLTHHNIVNNSFFLGKGFWLTEKDKICLTVSLSHIYGSVVGTLAALRYGSAIVIPSATFSPKSSLEAVAKDKCTVIFGPPTMHIAMMEVQRSGQYALSTLRMACLGAGMCPDTLITKIKKTYGVDQIGNLYGLTESGLFFQGLPTDSNELLSTTVGRLMDHFEVKVVDKSGRIVELGVPGEMCVRGYSTMRGYWADPEKTAAILDESNWLHTGDLMILHESGYASMIGRSKDTIIIGGENVHPKEVEDVLNSNENIQEAHAFGVPDNALGEVVAAWIRLKPSQGQLMTEESVKKYCSGKVAYFKIPCYIIFVKDFPRTVSGKVQKNKMKEHALTKRRLAQANSYKIDALSLCSN